MQEGEINWKELISQYAASGKSMAHWCKENEIGYDRFMYWRSKLERNSAKNSPGKFLPVRVASKPLLLECGGAYIHISSGFDPSLLKQVVSALRKA